MLTGYMIKLMLSQETCLISLKW